MESSSSSSRSKRIKPNGAEEAEALLFPILPEEIIREILLRLPFKSQCRFRCACKFWLLLLSSTEFTRNHIASLLREPITEPPPPTTQKLIVSTNTPRLLSVGWELIVDVGDKYVLASADIEYQLEDGGSSSSDFSESEDEIIYPPLEIVGSSDGWVCIGRGKHLYLFEPSTGKSMRVPEEDVSGFPVEGFSGFGFAYDSASDDYKVVRIIFVLVGVYSIKSGSWTAMDCMFIQRSYNIDSAVFLNGALHWAITLKQTEEDKINLIAVFDLEDEALLGIPTPEDAMGYDIAVEALNGCLFLLHRGEDNVHDYIWVLRDYYLDQSWIKLSISFSYSNMKPIRMVKDAEALLLVDVKLVLYNFEKNTYCHLEIQGIAAGVEIVGADVYMKKLILDAN